MRKTHFIALLFLACTFHAISQSVSERKDSLKMDSLKRQLHTLKGTDLIDRMIFICEYYAGINAADSVRFYGNKILKETKTIGYQKGIAIGILATAPDSLKEESARQAMKIGEAIKDEEVLGWAQVILNSTSQDINQNAA